MSNEVRLLVLAFFCAFFYGACAQGVVSPYGDGSLVGAQASPMCNLSGKWISAQRTLSVANYDQSLQNYQLAQQVRSWAYWEFAQTGAQVAIKKGLQCGSETNIVPRLPLYPETPMSGSEKLFDGITRNNSMQGRTAVYSGQSTATTCQLSIAKGAMVEGATFFYFKDFNHSLEEAITPAQGTSPGWEDWDEDGNPGVTYSVSGIAAGDLYIVRRELAEYRGTTVINAQKFKLDVGFQRQEVVVSTNPIKLEWPQFTPSSDQKEQFIWFARVDPQGQWNVPEDANDATLCAQVRLWKDSVIPEADN
jgi:hypothetical protein